MFIDLHYKATQILHEIGFTVAEMAIIFSIDRHIVQVHLNLYLGTKKYD